MTNKVSKNIKLFYFVSSLLGYVVPKYFYQKHLNRKIASYKRKHQEQWDYIMDRVDYYCKKEIVQSVGNESIKLKDFCFSKSEHFAYFFDTYRYTRYFPNSYSIQLIEGDVNTIPSTPSFVKSRPLDGDNSNSVLLKLNKYRHFSFINDEIPFEAKKDKIIGRAIVSQPHRIRFYEMWFGHPMCDLGHVSDAKLHNPAWRTPKISREKHLDYKFILCLEGNDVATNLKWVMNTNSLAVMTLPKFETWFMEGRLIPNYHYVAIKDDYSDLVERMEYYIHHTDEAQAIINHAHEFVKQFLDKKREDIVSLLVVQKYFEKTGQMSL